MLRRQGGNTLAIQLLLFSGQAQLLTADIGQTGVRLLGVGGHHDLLLLGQVGQLLVDLRPPGQGPVFQVHVGAGLIQQVDGLVRQIAVGDVPLAHGHRQPAHLRGDGHLVVRLIVGRDPLHNLHTVLNGGLLHHYGLEAPLQGGVLFDVLAVLVEGGGADHLKFSPAQGGLEDIGCVHGALGVAGAHDIVHLVDDQNDIAQLADLLDQALHPALKLAAELGASHQGSEIQQIDLLVLELIGDVTLGDLHGKPLGDGRLAHTGLADEAGVVLLPAVEDLNDPLQLPVPANEPVQLSRLGLFGQGDAVVLQKLPLGRALPLPVGGVLLPLGGLPRRAAAAAEQLAQEGEGGGASIVLLIVPAIRLGHQALHPLRAAKGGHHLIGEVIQVVIRDAHFLHHVIDGLDAKLPGTLEAETLVLGLAPLQLADKDHRYILVAAAAQCWLHTMFQLLSGETF